MGFQLRYPWPDLDPDDVAAAAIAVRLDVTENKVEAAEHAHRKGQLVFALGGGVMCRVPNGLWMVPPHCGVWLPGGTRHTNIATANARIFFVFIEPGAADLPDRCCTLSISPLLRELIIEFSDRMQQDGGSETLVAQLLLSELPRMPLQLSESTLARLILRETGLTFGRWRQQLHLIVALRELSAGASVQQVSSALGYESVTAFITMFKKALGKPPARYLSDIMQGSGSAFAAGGRI